MPLHALSPPHQYLPRERESRGCAAVARLACLSIFATLLCVCAVCARAALNVLMFFCTKGWNVVKGFSAINKGKGLYGCVYLIIK